MNSSLQEGMLFLINTLFNMYLFILVVRLILVYVGANYFDPVTQFVTRLTDVIVKPLRNRLPNIKRIEISTLLIIIILEFIKFYVMTKLMLGSSHLLALVLLTFADILRIILDTIFYSIIVQVILSWIQPYSPVNQLLYQINSPIMHPIRRIIPLVAGIDISPIFAIIFIQFINLVLVQTLLQAGFGMVSG